MRTSLLLTLVLAEMGLSLPALAAPPVHSEEEEAPPPLPPAQPLYAPPPAPVAPPPAAPAQQPMYFNGPVYIVPAWPTPQPVYPQAPPPVYAPPPAYAPAPPTYAPRPVVPRAAAPRSDALRYRFGLGARPTGMWISQRIYGSDLLLLGGGLQARLRVANQVALEATFDVVGKNIHDGVFDRSSYPIQVAALFYVMPPRQATHFNVYGAIGAGVMPSRIKLDDHNYPKAELKATELLGQAGVGCELRLWRISLNADARVIGAYRTGDQAYFDSFIRPSSGANSLSLTQPVINDKSYGWTFSLGAMLWL